MRTKKTTRASFSVDPPVVDVSLPRSWGDFSQKELEAVLRILAARLPSPQFSVFASLTGLRVLRRDGDSFLCRLDALAGVKPRLRHVFIWLAPLKLAELLEPLDFILDPGFVPVRLGRWHGAVAVDACLHGLSFGEYLQLENLYQGFLSSHNPDALISIARILYPGIGDKHVDDTFVFGLLQWVVQIKGMFARAFPNFFKPAGNGELPSMLEVMNNEIRALTGGDIAKEEVIFAADCWRALTELDFKAKEAEDYKRQTAN